MFSSRHITDLISLGHEEHHRLHYMTSMHRAIAQRQIQVLSRVTTAAHTHNGNAVSSSQLIFLDCDAARGLWSSHHFVFTRCSVAIPKLHGTWGGGGRGSARSFSVFTIDAEDFFPFFLNFPSSIMIESDSCLACPRGSRLGNPVSGTALTSPIIFSSHLEIFRPNPRTLVPALQQ